MNWINAYKKKPQAGKDVLAMDYMGNFFIGYVDADGNWWVSCYDDVDKELDATNIGVHRWCEIKQPKLGFFPRILHLKRKIKK